MILCMDGLALLTCYTETAETPALLRLVRAEAQDGIAISAQVDLEVIELILRLHGAGVPEADTTALLQRYQGDADRFLRLPADPRLSEAARLMARHGLEAGPALHLATALHLSQRIRAQAPQLPACPVRLVSFNPRLRAAAHKEGLPTWPD